MKRSALLGFLGIAIAASHAITSHGQGAIIIGNYQGAYNPVIWGYGPRVGLGVLSTEGGSLSLWYGEGVLTAGALTALDTHIPLPWNLFSEGNGYPGFYAYTQVTLPQWQPGDTYTFQVRFNETPFFNSAPWQEMANIANIGTLPPSAPGLSSQSIGGVLYIPEPSATAIVGLGVAGLAFLRRRK